MNLRQVFSNQTRVALGATPVRNLVSWGAIVGLIGISWIWPRLLPWWGWTAAYVAVFVGLALLGRWWADRDLAAAEASEEKSQ